MEKYAIAVVEGDQITVYVTGDPATLEKEVVKARELNQLYAVFVPCDDDTTV